jgi:predicted transcriptional regulator
MEPPPLGDQELEVLRYITDRPSASVGEVAEGFGAPKGLARTTIQTVMERLRHKGYLRRRKAKGVLRYSARLSKADLLKALVRSFRERVLGGSLEPFVAHLAEDGDLTEQDIEALQRLVRQLEGRRRGPTR